MASGLSLSTYTDETDKTKSWDVSDSITLFSDNGITPITGEHYVSNSSEFSTKVKENKFFQFYCPTCGENKSASQIKYHVCSACKSNTSLAGNNKYTTCTQNNCANKGKVFLTGNKCPMCSHNLQDKTVGGVTKMNCLINVTKLTKTSL